MGMVEGLIEQLGNSEAVKKGMQQFSELRDILVATVNRFDQRFGVIDAKLDEEAVRTKEILQLIKFPPDVSHAGQHVLALPESVQVLPCSVVGCNIPTIHEHGDGKPVSKNTFPDRITDAIGVVHESEITH